MPWLLLSCCTPSFLTKSRERNNPKQPPQEMSLSSLCRGVPTRRLPRYCPSCTGTGKARHYWQTEEPAYCHTLVALPTGEVERRGPVIVSGIDHGTSGHQQVDESRLPWEQRISGWRRRRPWSSACPSLAQYTQVGYHTEGLRTTGRNQLTPRKQEAEAKTLRSPEFLGQQFF